MADINDDGRMDLIYGDDYGFIRIYLRDEEGNLSFDGNLHADDEEFDYGDRATPQPVDFDLDGDYDIIVGGADGMAMLLVNQGTAESPSFHRSQHLQSDGEDINHGGDAAVALGDLDGDGKRDLVMGNIWGELWFYPNIGEDDSPEFGAGVKLHDSDGEIWLSSYTRPDLADWDGDGDLDILCGSINPAITLYLNPTINDAPGELPSIPAKFAILGNYPEPFNATTRMLIESPTRGRVLLTIWDLDGRRITPPSVHEIRAGIDEIPLSLNGIPAGRYLVLMESRGMVVYHRVTHIK